MDLHKADGPLTTLAPGFLQDDHRDSSNLMCDSSSDDGNVWFELRDGTFKNGTLIRGAKYMFVFNPSSEVEDLQKDNEVEFSPHMLHAGLRHVEVGVWDPSGHKVDWRDSSRTAGAVTEVVYSCENTASCPMSDSAAFTYTMDVSKVPSQPHTDRPDGPPQWDHDHPMQLSRFEEGAYARGWDCDCCHSHSVRGIERWFCQQCEHDICCVCSEDLRNFRISLDTSFLRVHECTAWHMTSSV